MRRIIETTDDGSATLFVPELNEHYHSTKGARTESQHIFINMGLKASLVQTLHILEIGFGTGLNAWLTLEEAEKSARLVNYKGLELYPLEWPTIKELRYIDPVEQVLINGKQTSAINLFESMHTSPWGDDQLISPHFNLQKIQADFTKWGEKATNSQIFQPSTFDIIYFDAFAPEKQPEMWSQNLFDYLYVLLNKGGILTTYCAKGVIRRMLQTAGFTVERLPGPPGGKREILRALK